jgi:hypothetical protein
VGEMIDVYEILVETPQGKRPFGRPGARWENIEINLWTYSGKA